MYNRDEELKYLSYIFDRFDKDRDKRLNNKEYEEFMYAISKSADDINCINDVVINAVFNYYDTDKDDLLTFEDIYIWWIEEKFNKFYIHKNCELIVNAYDIFKKYAHSKTLSYLQFEQLAIDNNIEYYESAFDTIDADQDGVMNFKEFVVWLGWFK